MPTSHNRLALPSLALTALAALVACGGGGGAGEPAPPAVNFGSAAPLPTAVTGPTTMSCVDGSDWQCSGSTILRTENGVSVTSSGVQAYGRSTSDLEVPNPSKTQAMGMDPTTGGVVDMRFRRDASSFAVTRAGMIMTNIGITWDDLVPRVPAIEVFEPTQGVTKLNADGSLSWVNPLPAPTEMSYYDWAARGAAANQANYANNRYFPRSAPVTCLPGVTSCADTETAGISYGAGAFRAGGTDPDRTTGNRLLSDGDTKAGSPPGSAAGVPFAGNKGVRNLIAFSYNYSNLGTWVTEETAEIDEWANVDQEHSVNRRGTVAFGQTTSSAEVPAAGGVDYKGVVFGWYTSGSNDLVYYRATATVSVNFDSRQVAVRLSDAVEDGNPANVVPLAAEVTVGLGASGTNVANYFTGAAASSGTSALTGGLAGRFFGPVGQGPFTTNQGPAEIAGSFTLKNATSKAATIGGFIGRRQ